MDGGLELGIQKRDLDDAKYAIVAFIDEQLFRAPWAGARSGCSSPSSSSTSTRTRPAKASSSDSISSRRDPQRLHVLEVFYLCLTLGFQGKYAVRGGDGLSAVIDRLASMLARATPNGEVLSAWRARRCRPWRREARGAVLFLAGGLVAVAIILAIVLKVALVSATSDVNAKIKTTVATDAPKGSVR